MPGERERCMSRESNQLEHQPEMRSSDGLRAAMQRARIALAERSDAELDLRGAELARLEMLRDALQPTFAELSDDAEHFVCAIAPEPTPRLWLDVTAHVRMVDRETYRLVAETLSGPIILFESKGINEITGSVTDYLAHRRLQRQRALASWPPAVRALDRDRWRGRIVGLAFLAGLCAGGLGALVLALALGGG